MRSWTQLNAIPTVTMLALTFWLALPSSASAAGLQGSGPKPLFDGRTLAGWTNPYTWGKAWVEDGQIVLQAERKFFLVTEKPYRDFIFEGEVKMPAGPSNSGFMFRCHVQPNRVFGCQDPAHFYYVHIATKADPHANSIFIVNGAPRVSIAKERTDGTDWGTGFHDARVVRNASTGSIEVFYDDMGKPIMRAEDKTFLSGGIGFGSFDDTGNIDDVIVWAK